MYIKELVLSINYEEFSNYKEKERKIQNKPTKMP